MSGINPSPPHSPVPLLSPPLDSPTSSTPTSGATNQRNSYLPLTPSPFNPLALSHSSTSPPPLLRPNLRDNHRPKSSSGGSISSSSGGSFDGVSSGGKAWTKEDRQRNRDSRISANRSVGGLEPATYAILSGAVGGSFGPFPPNSVTSRSPTPAQHYRDSMASSTVFLDPSSLSSHSDHEFDFERNETSLSMLYDTDDNKEVDDYLHNPNEELDRHLYGGLGRISWKGALNVGVLTTVIVVLIGLFAGWPIYRFAIQGSFPGFVTTNSWGGMTGFNASGQIPFTLAPPLIDLDTPQEAYTKKGVDGKTYNLVFSDEFNVDGRSFWPGDDPFWEAQNMWYWQTQDSEWYDPDAIMTRNGSLQITMSKEPINGLQYRSGFLQSWNKFCFTGGIIEMSMSLPGTPDAQGFWPAAWTMGNLGRAGYGATTEGVWPYSYNACDVGTLRNQTLSNGTTPIAAKTSGSKDYGGELSWAPGQRLSACTCSGEDHPGPNVRTGRGAPEIDIIEAGLGPTGNIGVASQSTQVLPIDAGYNWLNMTPYTTLYAGPEKTYENTWHGSVNQESMSVNTLTDRTSYDGKGFSSFGFEYDPGENGKITWAMNSTPTWQLTAAAMGPNEPAEISQRLISVEPMSININLAISETAYQTPEFNKLVFPATFRIDYVRVWQLGTPNVGCDPKDYPTSDYIDRHPVAYNDVQQKTWLGIPGNTVPKNSLNPGGCS